MCFFARKVANWICGQRSGHLCQPCDSHVKKPVRVIELTPELYRSSVFFRRGPLLSGNSRRRPERSAPQAEAAAAERNVRNKKKKERI